MLTEETPLVDSEAMHTTPRFVKDTSKYWYKPNISREEGENSFSVLVK